MNPKFTYYTKKAHRYLGVFIGIQFLFWTIGGLYFSWTRINEIRGEHLRKESIGLARFEDLESPSAAVKNVAESGSFKRLLGIRLVSVLQEPFYEISYESEPGEGKTVLLSARDSRPRPALSRKDAVEIATRSLLRPSKIVKVELLNEDDVGGHHEYRDKPLPAYAVTFAEPAGLVVYVARNTGRVESYRTNPWRVFDFFWMLHTLDLYARDDINNYLLRGFSVLGLVTLASGYLLFFVTSPVLRKKKSGRS